MEPAMRVALIRGSIIGFFTAGVAFFATWSTGLGATDASTEDALLMAGVAAGSAFFTTMLTRVGGEGTIDAARDARSGR